MEFSEPPVKRFRWTDYDSQDQTSTHSFALANRCEDDDKESVHSWQSDETAWVADSGDEWEPSEDEEESVTEYELAEDGSEEESHQSDSSASSDFTDARIPDDLLVNFQRAKDSSLGEESNTEDESGSELFRIMEKSIRHCFKCGTPTATPRMFCFACNQKRKWCWPPRPKRSARKRKVGKTADANVSQECARELGPPSDSRENLCAACHVHKRDGLFYHGRTGHAVYCYACTKKIAGKPNARCPVCRQTVNRAVKLFFC